MTRDIPVPVLTILVMILLAPAARANGPEIGFDAGTIFPIESRDIQLVSESVDIALPTPDFQYTNPKPGPNATCVYVLRNLTNASRTFSMAFVSGTADEEWGESLNALYTQNTFLVEQDGKPRPVTFLPGRGHEFQSEFGTEVMVFPTWTVTIGRRKTSTVRMKYNASWSGGSDGETGGIDFRYHARPARHWAGRIERATFVLHLGDASVIPRLQRRNQPWEVTASPSSYRWIRDGLRWDFRDWEPDSDLRS